LLPQLGVALALGLALAAPAARAEGRAWRFGFALGYGTQGAGPVANRNYLHQTALYKLLANRPLAASRAFSLELQLEPFLGVSHHRLRNPYFVDAGATRARFTKGETYPELGVDVGLVGRWAVTSRLSLFALAGVGPMYGDAATERLARGFAFSDVVSVGVGYRWNGVLLEVRPGFRHVSNAYLQLPNSGHNVGFVTLALSTAP
jgi:hypothetical protein